MTRRVARLVGVLLIISAAACTPPIRQFDLKKQTLTCEQANDYSYRALQSLGFSVTEFNPAAVGRPGKMRGMREELGTQHVTVDIACSGTTAGVDASEDGKILNLLDFKRAFYMAFTAVAAQTAVSAAAARQEAERPFEQKKGKGLQVLIEPVRGQGAKLDFDLDLAAGGVLPVRVTISNVTKRAYRFDPAAIVLVQKDGARVRPLDVGAAAQGVADAARQKAAANESSPPDASAVAQRLQQRLLTAHAVSAGESVNGYLFYPLAEYVKGRVSLEDQDSEDAEGFVVEF